MTPAVRRDRAAGVSLRNKKALPEGRAVDKMKDLGYSMDTGVLPVGRLPHALRRDNRYFGGQRLSLLVICLKNQGNDSSNEHAELENSFPCNIHTCHPLSFTIGGKEASPPKKSRGTAYRGTGSTTDSVAQISTDYKKKERGISRSNAAICPARFLPGCPQTLPVSGCHTRT